MSSLPSNFLQQVITYNESNLAYLQNLNCFLSLANKRFERFNDDTPKNLGDTVNFKLPTRYNTKNSLVISFQSTVERVHPLVIDQQISTAYAFSAQQFIFNAREFSDEFGRAAVEQIGAKIESYVAGMAETNTYRFYDGVTTPATTYLQLAQALAFHRNFGAAKGETKAVLSDLTFPGIVNSGLNQFSLDRGNKEAMSWEIGRFSNCDWYQSNLLATHVAGDYSQEGAELVVVSTNLNADGSVASINFAVGSPSSPILNSPTAVVAYDKFQFIDQPSVTPNIRFLTFIGGEPSQSPVQFSAQFNAASDGSGNVTVVLGTKSGSLPLLAGVPSGTQFGITSPIIPGMRVRILPNHRCGVIMSGKPLFLGMPKLPSQEPYPSSSIMDKETGASLRHYWGTIFGQNQQGFVTDAIYGATLVPEYAMMVALPM